MRAPRKRRSKNVPRLMIYISSAVICFLIVSAGTAAMACGPFFEEALFARVLSPDFPLSRFASGRLGIILPSFAESYLVVAYRYLTDRPTSEGQSKEFVTLWRHRLTGNYDADLLSATKAWLSERSRVKEVSEAGTEIDAYKFDGYTYSSYLNINGDAFRTAAATLKAKIEKCGATDKRVVEWTKAQDLVFSRGDTYKQDKAPVPDRLPEDAAPGERADRAYQIACSHFYGGEFDLAIEHFRAIAKDRGSRWSAIAPYLVARSLCRRATLAPELVLTDLKTARGNLTRILSNGPDHLKLPASRLIGFIDYRLYPERRLKELSSMLLGQSTDVAFATTLGDYTMLLSKVAKPEKGEETGTLPANPLESDLASQAILALLMIAGLACCPGLARTESGEIRRMARWITAPLLLGGVLVSLIACSTTPEAESASSAPLNAGGTTDELSSWILNFKKNGPEAMDAAFENWKESGSQAWLVSVITKLKASDSRKTELLAAAAKVPASSPAYLTVAYHRIRLLTDNNKDDARKLLGSILEDEQNKLPPSSRNMFLNQRLGLAENLKEFVNSSATPPAGTTLDLDDPDLNPAEIFDKQESSSKKSRPACLIPRAANTVNTILPLERIEKIGSENGLSKKQQLDFTQAAWVRSVLLNKFDATRRLSGRLKQLRPELSREIAKLEQKKAPEEFEFAAISMILKNPGFRPYVTAGMGRREEFNKIDSYRDNWWCAEPQEFYVEPEFPGDSTARAPFLTETEAKVGKQEFDSIKALGPAPNYLARKVLEWFKKKPEDPELAETLHYAVRSTRYGCTDDDTTKFSKQSYQALHKRYPKSPWARKTKYWF